LDVRSMLRIETRAITVGGPVHGTTVELLDGEGNVIGRAPLRFVATRAACGCGCKDAGEATDGLVHAYLRDHEGTAGVRVVREGSELWSRKATRSVPEIRDLSAECEGDNLRVRWQASTSDEYPPHYFMRWSADHGATWQALAINLPKDKAVVPLT